MAENSSRESQLSRWRGLIGLAGQRISTRALGTERQQTALSVVGIAVPIALMLIITSIGFGLATSGTIGSDSAEYRIVPEGAAWSAVTAVESQQLGQAHRMSARITARDNVERATPVVISPARMNVEGNKSAQVLIVGLIPSVQQNSFIGLPTQALTSGDPYFDNGSYDGTWTGEAVLSKAAAESLNASSGDTLSVRLGLRNTDRQFSVISVNQAQATGLGQFPVVLVHLSEIQAITGADEHDSADQILVEATDPSVKEDLEAAYPRSDVLTQGETAAQQARRSQLPLAMSLSAFLIAVVIGTLFVMTTTGFEIAADSQQRAVLLAIGFSRWSQTLLITAQTLIIALFGGIMGAVLWLIGITLTNFLTTTYLTAVPVASVRPVFAIYGIGVALLIGLLSTPYLLLMSHRTTTLNSLKL